MRRRRIISLKLRRRVTKNLRVFLLYCRTWKKQLPKALKSISIFSKKTWTKRFAISALIVTIIASSFTFFKHPTLVLGQTYNITQNDWSGGADPSTVNGPDNLTGHNKYESATGVTAGAGSVALTQSHGSVTESFGTTTNRDAGNTTATWTGSGQVLVPQYTATNLTAALNTAGINNFDLRGVATDPASGVVYFGYTKNNGAAKLLGKYNPATGTATDLSATISGFIGNNSVSSMVVDSGKLYFVGWYNNFAVYDPGTGLSTDLRAAAGIGDYDYANSLTVDQVRHKVYYGTSNGKLISFDTATATGTNLTVTSGLSTFWSAGTGIGVADVDPSNGRLYMVGGGGEFAVYNPSSGIATDLSAASGHSAAWGSIAPTAIVYSQVDSKLYMLGWNGSYVPIFTAYDTVAGTEANITSTSGILGKDGAGQSNSMVYDSVNGIIYIGSYWNATYKYTPGVAGSIVVLDDTVTGLSSIDQSVSVGGLAIDSTRGRLFIANYNSILGQLSIPPSSAVATSITLDSTLQNIASATLTKNDTSGTGTIQYQLSNNGGSTWNTVTPGSLFSFTSNGSDLRFRINLTGNATVQDVSITYDYYAASGELVSSKFDAVDPTNIVNQISWNENASLPAGSGTVVSARTAATANGLNSAPWINFRNGQPASEPTTVSETFATTNNRDAGATKAAWGSGQLVRPSYTHTDETAAFIAEGVPIPGEAYYGRIFVTDPITRTVYYVHQDQLFKYYLDTKTIVNITISSGFSTATIDGFYGMVYDNGKIYFAIGCWSMAYLEPATDVLQVIANSRIIGCSSIHSDPVRHLIYEFHGGSSINLAVYNINTGIATDLTASSGLPAMITDASWPNAMVNETNGKLYFFGDSVFCEYDPSSGISTNLETISGVHTLWPTRSSGAVVYNPYDGKMYLSGWISGTLFGVFNPATGLVTDLASSSGIGSIWPNAMVPFSGGGKIFIAADKLYVYDIQNNLATEVDTSFLSYPNINAMVVDESSGMLLVGGKQYDGGNDRNVNIVVSYSIPCDSCNAISTTLDATAQNILSATLTKNDTPGTGTVTYQLSNNGGTNWETVTPGSLHVFSSIGSDLRFKIILTGNATVQDVSIEYYSAVVGSTSCTKVGSNVTCDFHSVPASFQDGSGDRFFQYKITLVSDGVNTPTITSAAIQFVVNAAPEVRNVTAVQNANGTVTISYETRDIDTAGGTPGNVDHIHPSFEYWNGTSYQTITTLAAGDTDPVAVPHDGSWNNVVHTATWTPSTDYPGHWQNNTARIRVTANDNEGANPTGSAESTTFSLDTKTPTGSQPQNVSIGSGPWGGPVNSQTTNSTTITTGGASYILVAISADCTNSCSSNHVTSVVASGLNFVRLAGGTTPGGAVASEFWGAVSSGALAGVVVTATVSDPSNFGLSILSLNNVNASTPVGVTAGPNEISNNLSVSFNSTTAGSMLFATAFAKPYNYCCSSGVITAGTNTSVVANQNGTTQVIRSSSAVSGGTQTISSTGWNSGVTAGYAGVEIRSSFFPTPLFTIDASASTPTAHLAATDDNAMTMKVSSTDATLTVTAAEPYATTKTLPSLAEGNTVYAKIFDAVNNSTNIMSAPVPMTPVSVIVQDISNLIANPHAFRLFLAWKATTGAFASYRIHRSATNSAPETWPEIGSITSQATNYYVDNDVAEGDSFYYYITAVDSSGNISFRSSVVHATANGTQDVGEGGGGTAVAPIISAVSSGTPRSTQATITWDTDTLSNSVVEYSTSPSTFTTAVTVGSFVNNGDGVGKHSVIISGLLPETQYYFRVSSTDIANQTTVSNNGGVGYTFTTPSGPIISNTSVEQTTNTMARISWLTNISATTQLVHSIHADMSAPTVTTGTSDPTAAHVVNITNLNPGTIYYFFVRSIDASLNESIDDHVVDGVPRYYTFTTTNDTTPPIISDVSVRTQPTTADIIWTTSEPANSQVEYGLTTAYGTSSVLDGTATTRHVVTLTGLEPQTAYNYRIRSRDTNLVLAIGDNMTFTTNIAGDSTPPVITYVAVSSLSLNAAAVNWTTDEPATSYIEYGPTTGLGTTVGSAAISSSHSVYITGLLGNTSYYYRVRSADAAGNETINNNSGAFFTFTTAADTTEPVVSNLDDIIQMNSFRVVWTTNELADSQVEYGLTNSYGSSTVLDSSRVLEHSVTVSSLTAATTYHYRIITRDASGNLMTGLDHVITTSAQADITPPVITLPTATVITRTTATITWTTDEEATSEVQYGPNTTYGFSKINANDNTTAHSVTITGLTPGGHYYFKVISVDGSGNIGSDDNAAAGYTLTTMVDNTAPVVTAVGTQLVSENSVVISWMTDEPANSQVAYGTSNAFGSQTVTDPTLSTYHSVVITGLTPATPYFYEVISADAYSNSTTDNNHTAGYTFTTVAGPGTPAVSRRPPVDTTPPVIMNLQVGSIGQHTATIDWTTDEAADTILKYGTTIAYGTLAGSVDEKISTHRVSLTDLKVGTIYHFVAVSTDAFGNQASSPDRVFATLNEDGTIVPVPVRSDVNQPIPPKVTEEPPVVEEKNPIMITMEKLQDIVKKLMSSPNEPTTSEDFTQTMNDLADKMVSPPSIVGPLPKVDVTGVSVKISWTTDRKSNGAVFLSKDTDYVAKSAEPYAISAFDANNNTTIHVVEISDLIPATTYHFQVRSKGLIGGEARSQDATFVTASELPQITDLSISKVSDLSAVLTWKTNIPTKTDIEYKNLVSGTALTQGDPALLRDHKFTLDKLESGAPYTVVITATDENGGKTQSKAINLSTSKDGEGPVISRIKSESTLYPGKESRVQTIVSWTTDEPSTSLVYYQEGLSGDAATTEMPVDSVLTTSHTVVITKFRPATVYKIRVESTDSSGNVTKSNDVMVLTPQQKASVLDMIIKNFEQVFGWTKKI